MAFCRNCGEKIDDKAVICVHCGVATDLYNSEPQNTNAQSNMTFKEENEKFNKDTKLKKINTLMSLIAGVGVALGLTFSMIFYWIFAIPFIMYSIILCVNGYKKNGAINICISIGFGLLLTLFNMAFILFLG